MKRRILLVVLICFSLVLALMIQVRGSIDKKSQQTLAELDLLPKTERSLFNFNAIDYYKHTSKAAREERKRLRTLHHQLQNDPECEHLTKTMEQYVDWVKRIGDPAAMRTLQGLSLEERVEKIKQVVQGERQSGLAEQFTTERLREYIRAGLPTELREFDFPAIYQEFDAWLAQKYSEEKAKLSPQQLQNLPKFENLYEDLFRSSRDDVTPSETAEPLATPGKLTIPGKLAMLQLVQNLGDEPRFGGGDFGRFGRTSTTSFWRNTFFDQQKVAFDKGEPSLFDRIESPELRQLLTKMSQPERNAALQRLLALAVLEQHPKFSVGTFSFGDPSRFNQELGLDNKQSIDLLGNYLSIMTEQRRDGFLQMDPRFANTRLWAELWVNAMTLGDLTQPSFGGRPGSADRRPGGGAPGNSGPGMRQDGPQGGPPPDGMRDGGRRPSPPDSGSRGDGRGNRQNRPQEDRGSSTETSFPVS